MGVSMVQHLIGFPPQDFRKFPAGAVGRQTDGTGKVGTFPVPAPDRIARYAVSFGKVGVGKVGMAHCVTPCYMVTLACQLLSGLGIVV